MRVSGAVGAVVVAALCAACSGSAPTYQPTAGLHEQCGSVPDGARKAQVMAADGFVMGAAALGPIGSGEGVVVSYGQGQTICDWLDIGDRLAAATGAQVLILERRGKGSSPGKRNYLLGPGDVASGVNYVRAHGARTTVVIGSSLGTLFAFIGSSPTGPRDAVKPSDVTSAVVAQPPCAVALVSPLLSWDDNGGELRNLDVRSLQSKVFITYERRNATITEDARQVQGRATVVGATVVQTVGVDTKDHGLRLVSGHAEAFAVLRAAVDACR
jgi:pimeloyl-ACP methyl ester carboxylesterase